MATVLTPGTKVAVFAIRKNDKGPTVWIRAGNGCVNRDSSLNLWLDVLPIDGQLHIRESASARRAPPLPVEAGQPAAPEVPAQAEPVLAAGGQS